VLLKNLIKRERERGIERGIERAYKRMCCKRASLSLSARFTYHIVVITGRGNEGVKLLRGTEGRKTELGIGASRHELAGSTICTV